MKSIGKNFAALILVAIFTVACITPDFAKASNVSLISDVPNKSVSILGQLGSDGGVNYIVNIASFSEDIVAFSESFAPSDSRLYTTYLYGSIGSDADEDDYKGETIYFTDYGHYSMYIYYNEGGENKIINRSFFVIDESNAIGLLAGVNAAASKEQFVDYIDSDAELATIGIWYKDIASSGEFPMEYAYDMMPSDGGYDVQGLHNAINEGNVIYIIKNYGMEALTENAEFLGRAYRDKYLRNMSGDEKTALDGLLKTAEYTSDTLPNVFSNMVDTAIIKSCTNEPDMEATVKSYASKLGISMGTGSDYDKISDTKKYMVFEGMVNDRANFNSMANVAYYFNKYVGVALGNNNNGGVGDDGGGSSSSLGGPSSGSQTSSGNILNPGAISPLAGAFNDISGHFAKNDIEKLARLGIINGNPDGSYRPNNSITRAEFAKLVATMFAVRGGQNKFYDINENDWFAPFVNALAERGIITGFEGYFNPNDNIKREDAVLMLQRAAKLFGIEASETNALSFADEAQISSYAKDAVTEFSKMGIVNGDGVNFHPLNPITRGEVAAVLSRLYDIYVGKGA